MQNILGLFVQSVSRCIDQFLIDAAADRLNAEMEDVLEYQVPYL